ncbi:MAG: TIR domain-containing protein [Anaerolineae bacterium]|nr:TIR domain-containing protein [Anaerolineae bacterium]
MSHIFISYSRKDADFAEIVREQIVDAGFEVWMDSILPAGFDWRQEIDQSIRQAFALLVVISPDSKVSEYVTYEWAFALGIGIKVIPLIYKPAPLHPRLETVQHIDFTRTEYYEQSWQRLMDGLHHIRRESGKATGPASEVQAPKKAEMLGTTRMDAPGVWLMVERGPLKGQEWNLNKDEITIGRDITNDIVINDQQVSRRHVRFARNEEVGPLSFLIEDLDSSNGTFVNGERLSEPLALKHGDHIVLGETVGLIYQIIVTVNGRRIPL